MVWSSLEVTEPGSPISTSASGELKGGTTVELDGRRHRPGNWMLQLTRQEIRGYFRKQQTAQSLSLQLSIDHQLDMFA
jgi:hypothetical protein